MEESIKHIISLSTLRDIISEWSSDAKESLQLGIPVPFPDLKELVAVNISNLILQGIHYNTQEDLLENASSLFYSTARLWLGTSEKFRKELGLGNRNILSSDNNNRLEIINNVQDTLLDWIKGQPPLLEKIDNLVKKYRKMEKNNTTPKKNMKARDSFVYTNVIGGLQKIHLMPTEESLAYKGYADATVNKPGKTKRKRRR